MAVSKENAVKILAILAAVLTLVSAGVGLLSANGAGARTVENIYGQEITLYGTGIYANNSLLKAGATKGTDVVAAMAALLLLVLVFLSGRNKAGALLRSGLLAFLLYATSCLVMGVSFNALFPVYVAQFSATLFSFILSMKEITGEEMYRDSAYQKKWTGTGVFLIISGCSVLVWLSMIIPAVVSGEPMEIIEIYTTEPTFVLDLAVILPSAVCSGVMLLRAKSIGVKLAPVLMTLLTGVGLCVIFQTVFQSSLGIELLTGQIVGLVGSFVCLGAVSAWLNARLLMQANR